MRTASPTPNHRFAAVLPLLMLAPLSAVGQGQTHTYIPERGIQSFAVREPVLRLAPGDTLISETMNGAFLPEGERDRAEEVGPIYIEGSERGDTLVTRVIRLELNRDRAYSGTSAGFAMGPGRQAAVEVMNLIFIRQNAPISAPRLARSWRVPSSVARPEPSPSTSWPRGTRTSPP